MACIHMPFPLLMEMNDPHVHLCLCKDPAVLLHSAPQISLCLKQVKMTNPHSQLGSLSHCCHAVDVPNIRRYSSIFLSLDNYSILIANRSHYQFYLAPSTLLLFLDQMSCLMLPTQSVSSQAPKEGSWRTSTATVLVFIKLTSGTFTAALKHGVVGHLLKKTHLDSILFSKTCVSFSFSFKGAWKGCFYRITFLDTNCFFFPHFPVKL